MDNGRWVTIRGHRVFIKDKATNDYMNKKIRNKGKKYNDSSFKYLPEDDTKAYDKYVEMSEESYQNMDDGLYYEVSNNYVGNEYSTILNENLREGKATDKNLIEAMDYACKSYTAKEDMASTRFVNMDYLRNAYGLKINQYGDIDRNQVAKSMREFLGSEISSKAYTSVSLNESGNGLFNNLAVKMKINMPKGTKMFVADNVGEYEAILGRNKRMVLKDVGFQESKIKGFEKEYGKILLTYEVIEDDKR